MAALPSPRFLDSSTPPALLTLTLMAGLGALSMNIFLPSLPDMTSYFNAEYRLMQLSVALYLGVNAALQVIIGPISDRAGRRPVMLWSLVLFMLATLGCLFAPTAEIFLAFRMMQAVVVGGLVLSRAVVRDMVPPDRAASMMGYVTMGMSLVPMIGPAIGGVIGEAFGWQANFWVLLLLGAVVFWLCWRDLGETAEKPNGHLIDQIREYPALLTSPRFWGYCLTALFASGSFFAYLGGAPFVGTEIYHLDQSRLGLFFGTAALGYLVGNYVAGSASVRVGLDRMILAGAFFATTGLAGSLLLHYFGLENKWVFFGAMIPVGLGNGMLLPNANAGMLSVRPHLAGSAAGLGGAMMIGGGAVVSAVAGSLLSSATGAYPLLWLMFLSALMSVGSILMVMRRSRYLAG
jgi:DHA1 family bicyclomycin/chloramphenicol resistance-like MFS transporter